jgi:hypothetical protein
VSDSKKPESQLTSASAELVAVVQKYKTEKIRRAAKLSSDITTLKLQHAEAERVAKQETLKMRERLRMQVQALSSPAAAIELLNQNPL